jgi:biofilm PGA synthesis N-glycosyltransferase PgaC
MENIFEPEVAVVIAAYNEAGILQEKIENTLALAYPASKLKIHIVTDGSTDNSEGVIKQFNHIHHHHTTLRKGKLAAVQRIMPLVHSPIIILTDANCMLNEMAIKNIVRHYKNEKVGAVAGEKRVRNSGTKAGEGEGLYWRYESWLKKIDSDLYSTVGAAGELFSFRRNLYEELPANTIIEDFVLSMRIAMRGYKVVYEPNAYAAEEPSASLQDEWKRKVRICAGGFQSLGYLPGILNPFKYGLLSLLFISHRFLRWAVVPFLLPVLWLITIVLATQSLFFSTMLAIETLAIALGIIGLVWKSKSILAKPMVIAGYILMMNAAAYAGLWRYIKGTQSVVWDKAQRHMVTG